jgi:sugar phosphate isomerase/epimerase
VATSFGGLELPVDQAQIAIHKRRIEYAALLGAEAYGLFGGTRLRWRPPNQAEYEALATACETLALHAAALGLRIGYHPHTGCTIETGAEIDILLGLTQATQLCLDASHIALVDEDPVVQIRRYAQRTSYVHVKDWARGKFVELGLGTHGIDFPSFFAALEAMEYPGWVVVENSRSDVSPAESARINADYIRGLGYSLALPTREAL